VNEASVEKERENEALALVGVLELAVLRVRLRGKFRRRLQLASLLQARHVTAELHVFAPRPGAKGTLALGQKLAPPSVPEAAGSEHDIVQRKATPVAGVVAALGV